jgi:hypothetical protein
MCASNGKVSQGVLVGTIAVILGAIIGCSSAASTGPATYPVQGKVVSPGGQPWTGGLVTFRSTSDPGMMASGEIQADGSFTLTTYYVVAGQARTKPGAVAGEHTVTVEERQIPAARGAVNKISPIILNKKCRVEVKENSLLIEVPRPGKS